MIRTAAKSLTRMVMPRASRMERPSRKVAIVIPLSARAEFTPEEIVSLRHVVHFLGQYDKYLVAPRGLAVELDGFKTIEFSRKFFGSMLAYNRLMYLPALYECFREYEYILMYHLDSLVFSDDLLTWCATGVDYIGAPWFPGPDSPWATEVGVGNGGFALMKVESILKVLYRRYEIAPLSYWRDVAARNVPLTAASLANVRPNWLSQAVHRLWQPVLRSETNRVFNDIFWAYHARQFVPEFNVPDWETALCFAFEGSPRRCFELTGGRLPFGCHAWPKFDRTFWEPYLLPPGPGFGSARPKKESARDPKKVLPNGNTFGSDSSPGSCKAKCHTLVFPQ